MKPPPPPTKKRKRTSDAAPKEKQTTKTQPKGKKSRAPKVSKSPQQQLDQPQRESYGAVYDQLFLDYQAAQDAIQFQQQQQLTSQQQPPQQQEIQLEQEPGLGITDLLGNI